MAIDNNESFNDTELLKHLQSLKSTIKSIKNFNKVFDIDSIMALEQIIFELKQTK